MTSGGVPRPGTSGVRRGEGDVKVRRAGRVALVVVGECAVDCGRELRLALEDALRAGQDGVIVDLGDGVEVVDSAALGAIALASRRADQRRQPLCLVAGDDTRTTVERAGLDRVVAVARDLGEAFACVRRRRAESRRAPAYSASPKTAR